MFGLVLENLILESDAAFCLFLFLSLDGAKFENTVAHKYALATVIS
jgi:hypothetical protein